LYKISQHKPKHVTFYRNHVHVLFKRPHLHVICLVIFLFACTWPL